MENVTTASYVTKALQEYNRVKEELNRPQEDLVMIAACELVKSSIGDFLHAYLHAKDIHVENKDDILQMQEECIKLNDDFKIVDLSSIAVLSEDSSMSYTHALEDSRLTRYTKTLDKVKELVLSLI